MEYYKPNNQVCRVKYKCEIHELYKKENKTEKELEFIRNYEFGSPVNVTPCLCNKIAWMVEEHFRDVSLLYKSEPFDCELLKNPHVQYSTNLFNKVKQIKEDYDKSVQLSLKTRLRTMGDSYEANDYKDTMLENFTDLLYKVCGNEEVLCNILVDVCYNSNKSKSLLWDVCGDTLIKNLLKNKSNKLYFPLQSEDGDFTYKGLTFKMEVVELEIDSE